MKARPKYRQLANAIANATDRSVSGRSGIAMAACARRAPRMAHKLAPRGNARQTARAATKNGGW